MTDRKLPHEVDRYVGAQIRARRMMLNLSQEEIGKHLGVTFQQLQKYERGDNRVSASRLFRLSCILDVDPNYFFDGLDRESTAVTPIRGVPSCLLQQGATDEGHRLAMYYTSISEPKKRAALVDVAQALAL